MTERQAVGRDAIFAHPTHQSHEGSFVAQSEEEGDNNSLLESAIDNDYPLPSQPMSPTVVPSEILSLLTDISGTNTSRFHKNFRIQMKIFWNQLPQINLEAHVNPAQNLE